MTDAIVHRGPDDFGYLLLDSHNGKFQTGQTGFQWQPCDVFLGNRRLSIIDLSPNGRQPIRNEASDTFAIFNGEIFNYLELRNLLEAKGHIFRSQTDSEVIIHAYEQWGTDCVKRFNGMWALAIWDQRKRELFCSRDRFGIKPFYYYLDASAFLFASEIKGILPALDARPSVDYGVLSDYLLHQSLCQTRDTFFEGIKRLEPAHNLVVSASDVRVSRYWNYRDRSQLYDEHRPVETFRDLLNDAVRLRLRSDVPVGVALSGGVDSTSILACAARLTGPEKLKAFTAMFPGERFDEHKYARLASQEVGAPLFCIEYYPGHFIEDLRKITWSLDYPALEGQILPRWHLMRLASRHVKVILEGQGADELLAGYTWKYFAPYLIDEVGRLRSGCNLLTLRKLFVACWEEYRRNGGRVYKALLRQLLRKCLRLRMRQAPPADGGVYTREFKEISASRKQRVHVREFDERLTNLLHYDHMTGILPMLLKFGDALSMASSIESRLPFLDHRLVEFVFQLPTHHKFDGSVSKGILREAMAGAMPEQIRSRKDKVGFETPMSRWISQCLDSGIRPILLSDRCKDREIFDMKKIESLLSQQARGLARLEHSIFRWLSVELWFRLFIDGEGITGVPVSTLEAPNPSTR